MNDTTNTTSTKRKERVKLITTKINRTTIEINRTTIEINRTTIEINRTTIEWTGREAM